MFLHRRGTLWFFPTWPTVLASMRSRNGEKVDQRHLTNLEVKLAEMTRIFNLHTGVLRPFGGVWQLVWRSYWNKDILRFPAILISMPSKVLPPAAEP